MVELILAGVAVYEPVETDDKIVDAMGQGALSIAVQLNCLYTI